MKKTSSVPATRKAATYQRVSTDKQEKEGISLEAQEHANLGYAARNGYIVDAPHVYRESRSGGDLWQRAELMRMMAAAQHGEFQAVICYCVDRLTRELFHLGWIRSTLEQYGVELLFVTESYDDSLEADLMLSVRSVFGREERRKISRRIRDARHEQIRQGIVPGQGTPAYGYLRGNGTLTIVDAEAGVVRLIFRWAADGMSANAITRRLNEQGVPPPCSGEKNYGARSRSQGHWCVATVAKMLRNSIYRGELVVLRERSVKTERNHGQRDRVRRPREEWKTLPVPAIVSVVEWQAAQETLSSRRGVSYTRNAARPALLRGLIYCSHCGLPLHPDWNYDGAGTYRCCSRMKPTGKCGAGQIRAGDIEPWAWQTVEGFLRDPTNIAREVQQRGAAGPDPQLLAELKREELANAEVERRQERLLSLFSRAEESTMPVALVQKQLAEAEAAKQRRAARITALNASLREQEAAQSRLLSLSEYVQRVAVNLERFGFPEKRLALEALGCRVVAAGSPRKQRGQPAPEWRVDISLDPEKCGVSEMPVTRRRSRPCWSAGGAGV